MHSVMCVLSVAGVAKVFTIIIWVASSRNVSFG